MTYVGELGLGADRPGRAAPRAVYDALFGEGADLGVGNAGYYAIDSLRLEKGYRAFGSRADARLHARSRPGWSSPPR